MDFGALPPEMNSARMYAGPGAGSMLGTAAAWDALADELYAAASGGSTVVAALVNDSWLSQASMAMTAAAATYFAWLSFTAAQAQQTAKQLLAAAGAFESAFAATVPPAVIAANRALVLLLTATNVLGVNTPAIAAADADYGQMWAQDAAAMYGYAASSAVAATLPEFGPPPEVVVDSTGLANRAVSADQTSALARLTAAVPQVLRQLADPMDAVSSVISPASTGTSMVSSLTSAMSSLSSVADALGSSTVASSELAAVLGPLAALPGVAGPAVAAEIGKATSIGQLSVPASWAAAPAGAVAGHASAIGTATVPEAGPAAAANMMGGLPITAATRGENSASGAGLRPTLPDGFRLTVVPRFEAGG